MKYIRRFKRTLLLTVLTPLLFFICFFMAGGGHSSGGTYVPTIVLFPWGSLPWLFTYDLPYLFQLLFVLQFPVYGVLLDLNAPKKRRLWMAILIIHITLSVLILVMRPVGFR